MMHDKQYFVPVFLHQVALFATAPDGKEIAVAFMIEDVHFDADRLIDEMERNDSRIIVPSAGGTVMTGRALDLQDIIGWAIENGYLESVGSEPVASSPV